MIKSVFVPALPEDDDDTGDQTRLTGDGPKYCVSQPVSRPRSASLLHNP
jgi:hypothetical protein